MTSPWYLYVLECERGVLYAGIATDVEARFCLHAKGKGAAFTRINRPVRILASAPFASRGEATRAEQVLKKKPRKQKLIWVRENPHRERPPTPAFSETAPRPAPA